LQKGKLPKHSGDPRARRRRKVHLPIDFANANSLAENAAAGDCGVSVGRWQTHAEALRKLIRSFAVGLDRKSSAWPSLRALDRTNVS
jgi:hypothetical protein